MDVFEAGRPVGKYRIVDRLGRGGMAEVFKAHQASLDRHVALKVIKTSVADDPDYLARFEREAKSAAALHHPNIVPIYDFDIDGETGRPYIVMELIEGGTLADYLAHRKAIQSPLSMTEIAHILGEVSAALGYAHRRGVVHRDVKPANIMRDAGSRLILTDFGLAKVLTGSGASTSGPSMGTPDYMAPEQVLGERVDARADLYALGLIAYQLLVGQLPYQADTPLAVMIKHVNEPPPDPRAFNPALTDRLAVAVLKSIARTPDDRFQTADEFRIEFEAALAEADRSVEAPSALRSAPTAPAAPRTAVPPRSTLGTYVVTLEIAPPPEPSLPPKMVDFVGREKELAYFADRLSHGHLAVLTGMPGIGKTALAAKLAERLDRPALTFWHDFHAGEGVSVLIWKLAGFLAWHDRRDLWNTLQGSTQTGNPTPPPEVLLDYLFQMVRGPGYLLCFDDFHCVDDDPLLEQFIDRLRPALDAGQVGVIVAAQRRPAFVREGEFEALSGLALADIRTLIDRRGLTLPDALIADLHAYTSGNAELIMLTLDALRRAKDPSRMVHRLSESEQVERFLVKQVDEGLSDEERRVMCAVAALMDYPGTRDAIAAVLDGASVRRPLNDLVSRSLLTVAEGESGKEYALNVMLGSFYYDLIDQRERQAMHRRAGGFYENDAPDALRAAIHYQRCGEQARAVRLITADLWTIINRGEARALRQILDQFTERHLDEADWVKALIARGQVQALLGETESARESYASALPHAEATPELAARACLGLGELLQSRRPQEARDWLRRGLDALRGVDSVEEAALRIRVGRMLIYQGDHDAALAELQRGLDHLPRTPSRLRISALGNLGNLYAIRGDAERSMACYQQVLDTARRMNDYWAMNEVRHDLGIALDGMGRWADAIAHYQQELEQAERIGSVGQQARAHLGLGNTHLKLGDEESARNHLDRCIELARGQNWEDLLIYAGNSLAGLQFARSELDAAETQLAEVEQLAQSTGVREQLPETYRYRALLRLAQDRRAEALADAGQSVALAREFQSLTDEGIGLRVLGQAQWANDRREAALSSFETSWTMLTGREPYEAARTQAEWGQCLAVVGESERGDALLREARETFERLGAPVAINR